MSYSSIVEMASSEGLIGRLIACAADEGVDYPEQWTRANTWKLAATTGWGAKWDSALASPSPNVNPDTGARNDVITDQDILAAVQAAQLEV